jgi:hypothetical protein
MHITDICCCLSFVVLLLVFFGVADQQLVEMIREIETKYRHPICILADLQVISQHQIMQVIYIVHPFCSPYCNSTMFPRHTMMMYQYQVACSMIHICMLLSYHVCACTCCHIHQSLSHKQGPKLRVDVFEHDKVTIVQGQQFRYVRAYIHM